MNNQIPYIQYFSQVKKYLEMSVFIHNCLQIGKALFKKKKKLNVSRIKGKMFF